MQGPLDYPSPQTEPPRGKRTLGKWIVLLLVWTVGIVMWMLYLALAGIVLLRIL